MKLTEIKTKTRHYFKDEEGQIQGKYKSWYKNGQQWEICYFRDDELHGEYKTWHPGGQPRRMFYCRYSIRHGEYKEWDSSGELFAHHFDIDGEEVINFLENPELYPSTPEEKTMFVLKYGNAPFIK